MILDLPKPVAAYFAADGQNGDAVAQCFAESAVVQDEGHTYRGRPAIKKWRDDAAAKYQYTSEPVACDNANGKIVVVSRLTGNFPGSPANLRFFFSVAGDQIETLEILP